MKHLARIQTDFLKQAAGWEDFSRQRQLEYLGQHPKSKRHITADLVNASKDTKDSYLSGMNSWVQNEKHHKPLAIVLKNFMHKYLPERFYKKLYDEDLHGDLPPDLFERLANKYDLPIYLDETSGKLPESALALINEKTETVSPGQASGEYLRIKVATGVVNGKRMIISGSERTGLADIKDKEGKVIGHHPYKSHAVELILGAK